MKPLGETIPQAENSGSQIKQGLIYAMRLLTASKKSETLLRTKLLQKGFPPEAITEIIRVLVKEKYLDDLSLAKNMVYWAKNGRPIGRRRILMELKKKGIAGENADAAIQEYEPAAEKELAAQLAQEKFEKLKSAGLDRRKTCKRLYDLLVRKGFDYEICRSVISDLERRRDNDGISK